MANCLNDVLIASAAAQVSRNPPADFLIGWIGIFLQQAVRSHDHAWCAVSALETVLHAKRLLKRMERPIRGRHAFNRCDVRAVDLHRENSAALDRLAVEINGADTTMGRLTPYMSASQVEAFTQSVDEEFAIFDLHLLRLTVEGERDYPFSYPRIPPLFVSPARSFAFSSARPTMTPAILRRYSALPRPSDVGLATASAAFAAASMSPC